MKKTLTALGLGLGLSAALAAPAVQAEEGMWTLDNLPLQALKDDYGFTPDPAWLAHAQRSVVRLAGGCSGSFVSPEGLVLTNYHCVMGCVQQLSSADRDILKDGFVAADRGEELRCPTYELNRLEEVSDVTARIHQATQGLEGDAYTAARQAESARITAECSDDDSQQRCDIVELYHGGRYHLYRYQRFQDVRLAFAPESAMGLFGGDPDNFNFPRYSFDMALLRAWQDGKPVATPEHFPINPAGAEEGGLTMILGHPGSTQRLLTVAQLEAARDHALVSRLLYLSELRGLLNQYASGGEEQLRHSQAELMGVENSLKVMRGMHRALADPAVFELKRAQEQALRDHVAADPQRQAQYAGAWEEIARAQAAYLDIAAEHGMLELGRGFHTPYFRHARTLVRAAAEREKPDDQRLPEFNEANLPRVVQGLESTAPIHPDYEKVKLAWSLTKLREELGADAPAVRRILGRRSPEAAASAWIDATSLADPQARLALWQGGAEAIEASEDPFIVLARNIDPLARAVRSRYEDQVESVLERNAQRIAQARFDLYGTRIYPDATFSLRLSYGSVKGWNERGTPVPPFTTTAGLFQRATGQHPWALPPSWLAAQERLDPDTRFNFVSSNDIIGGNSGSPVINAAGEVIGLVFDGNIHALGGAYWYDAELNRGVSVHPAIMLEALEKVYDAGHLLRELR